MTDDRLLRASQLWFRTLLRLYPADFRDEMGDAFVETYSGRARRAIDRRGVGALAGLWVRALGDSFVNGPAERLRPAASWRRAGNWGRDIELARRRLWRSRGFVAATLATLTVGLAAFAVVYTALDKIVLTPMPYRDPASLYYVWRDQSATGGVARDWLAGPDVADLQQASGVIESAAGMRLSVPTLALRPDGEPQQVLGLLTSPNLFDLLGTPPALGRSFAADEAGPGRPPVTLLSHALWTRLGADPSLVGKPVWLSGEPYTVIGVTRPDFRFVRHATVGPPQEPDLYIPFPFRLADQDPRDPNQRTFAAVIRVRPGTSQSSTTAAIDAVSRTVNARNHQTPRIALTAMRLQDDLIAPIRPVLIALGLAAVFLLLVLTVNLASLLLARAAEREREFAISRALGASGSAVLRAMIIEGGALGLMGGGLGALAGSWGARLLVSLAPLDLPRRSEIVLDWRVAAVVIAAGFALGIIAAVLPSAWVARASLATSLVTTGIRGAGGAQRWRRGIIVAQVALTMVLLCAGGLVARSFQRLLVADPGFSSDHVLTFRVAMDPRLFPTAVDAFSFQARVETALTSLPGVRSVGATAALPLATSGPQNSVWSWQEAIRFPGAPGNSGDAQRDAVLSDVIAARAGYVDAMNMRIVEGRSFTRTRPEGIQEVLIDQQLAKRFFPTGSPIGASIPFIQGKSLRVVGVVKQTRLANLHEDGRPQVFIRAEDWVRMMPVWVVKTTGDPRGVGTDVRQAIRRIDPRIPVSAVQTMDDIVSDSVRQQRISAVMIGGFALGALLLAAMGLFGMISGAVVRRRGELAIRLALGANQQRMVYLAVAEGATLVIVGMVVAVPGVFAAGGLVRSLLIDVSPWDPLTLSVVAVGLVLVTLTACYVPARRVLRIDPASLLRQD